MKFKKKGIHELSNYSDTEKLDNEVALQRVLSKKWKIIVSIIAVLFSCFQLYTGIFGSLPPQLQRSIFLSFALILAFLLYPLKKSNNKIGVGTMLLLLGSFVIGYYWVVNYIEIILRAGEITQTDFLIGLLAIVLVLEATRRACGWPVFIIGLLALMYCYFGPYFPDIFAHRGFSAERIVAHMYLGIQGILGVPIGVVSTFVFLFLLFGAFLTKTGVGLFFNDFANALAGWSIGGPAKVAVISSALQGTISGSSVANTVASGSFTIPMMKKMGYRPEFAAAVEASASTGGQLMPPIMGAAAFLMAEFTGVPYIQVALAAAIPAILYFTGIFISVHIEAKKLGLKGLSKEEIPSLWHVIKTRGILFSPVLAIVYVLATGHTPMRAALIGILTSVLAGAIFPGSRMGIKDFLQALEDGAKSAVTVGVVCATAGIVVGAVSLTGLGLKLATILVEIAHGNLLITMFLTMISSLILGIGIPTTANYIITSTICAPAMLKLGIPILAAHLFTFYFGITADVTPPVCEAVFAGAGIAKANPLKSGIIATKLSIGAFIVPYIFVLSPQLLLIGASGGVLLRILPGALIGMICISSAVQGWLRGDLGYLSRIILFSGGIMLIDASVWTDLIGLCIVLAVYFYQKLFVKIQFNN